MLTCAEVRRFFGDQEVEVLSPLFLTPLTVSLLLFFLDVLSCSLLTCDARNGCDAKPSLDLNPLAAVVGGTSITGLEKGWNCLGSTLPTPPPQKI